MLLAFLSALVPPFFDSMGNIVDSKITQSLKLHSFIFYSTIFGIPFIPLVFFFGTPVLPPLQWLPVYFLLGALEALYIYPYALSLKQADASVVSALFSLGRISTPILAFFLIGERLPPIAYM